VSRSVTRTLCLALGLAAGAATLAACGGGVASSVFPPPPQSGGGAAHVAFSITLPAGCADRVALGVRPKYISCHTSSIALAVAPGKIKPTTNFVIINCHNRTTCTGAVDAPAGQDTFLAKLYGHPNGRGNVLSTGFKTQNIALNTANTVSLTFDPVVGAVSLSLDPPMLDVGGSSNTAILSVNALDPSGATIVGSDPFVDAAGEKMPLSLTNSNPAVATVSQTTFRNANQASATVTYLNNLTNFDWPILSVTGKGLPKDDVAGTQLVIVPTFPFGPTETTLLSLAYPIHNSKALYGSRTFQQSSKNVYGIVNVAGPSSAFVQTGRIGAVAVGSDGDVWFAGAAVYNPIGFGKVDANLDPSSVVYYPQTTAGFAGSGGLALGADKKNLWFDAYFSGSSPYAVGYIAPNPSNGQATFFHLPPSLGVQSMTTVTPGPANLNWLAVNTSTGPQLVSVDLNGTFTSFPLVQDKFGIGYVSAIGYSPYDGNLYVETSGFSSDSIFRVTSKGAATLACSNVAALADSHGLFGTLPDGTLLYAGNDVQFNPTIVRIAPGAGCAQIVIPNWSDLGVKEFAVSKAGLIAVTDGGGIKFVSF
jgi:hypothetical protein